MTPEDKQRLDAISDALARLAKRQDELEERIARLVEERPSTHRQWVRPAAAVLRRPATVEPPAPAENIPPRRPSIEAALGLTWVSRVAVVTVVLALAFFFQYAFERRWITETGRVLLGVASGLAAMAGGELFWRREQRVYAQSLTAAGIAFVYLSLWAAYGPYRLLGLPAAFALMALTTAIAGALAFRYGALPVAVLGLAGGFATPLLLGGAQARAFVLGYALVLSVGAAFASRKRGWRVLEALAVLGTALLYISQMPVPDAQRWQFSAFIAAYYGLFAASRFRPVSIAAQLLSGMALAGLWSPASGGLWAAVAVASGGLWVAERRQWGSAVPVSLAGFWLAYLTFYPAYAAREPAPFPVLAAITAAYLLFLAWPVWRAAGSRLGLRFPDLVTCALNAGLYFGAGYGLLNFRRADLTGLFVAAVAMAQAAQARVLWTRDNRGATLAGGAAWVLLVLAAPLQFAGYRVTIVWAAEAAAIAWTGVRLREKRALYASAAAFALVLIRLAFIDGGLRTNGSLHPLIGNPRFLAFAVSACALWATAWWVRRGWLAASAYLGGHGAMLWGLCLEGASWGIRAAAPENTRSVVSTAVSVIVAGYAVLLVAGGASRRHAPTRVSGMALIGAVVLKLYLYDIWLLGPFYRMAAFAILGALLWIMAYLYSRYRTSIGTWWRGAS